MRVRDHLAFSTIAAVLAAPLLGRKVLAPWAASILIDADHMVGYSLRERSINPIAAVRYFNTAQPEQSARMRALHTPWALAPLAVAARRSRAARLILAGMLFHVALDGYHELRTERARRTVLRRDRSTCQACGASGDRIVAHKWRQPRLFPSYRPECFVSLCPACHEDAHTLGIERINPGLAQTRSVPPSLPIGVPGDGLQTPVSPLRVANPARVGAQARQHDDPQHDRADRGDHAPARIREAGESGDSLEATGTSGYRPGAPLWDRLP
ncbi:MAG TPA: hypothetical protein VF808_15905 [Ktedonobacterales bacterium]